MPPSPPPEVPPRGAYRQVVAAPTRDRLALRAGRALRLHHHRQPPGPSPIVGQASTAGQGCPGARARQPRLFPQGTRQSTQGRGWGEGFARPGQGEDAGGRGGVALPTATGAARQRLGPRTRGRNEGRVGGAGGSRAQAQAQERAARGVSRRTPTRKTLRPRASPFQGACRQVRPRGEERCEVWPCAFGAGRTPHRAPHALPIPLLGCVLAYSLYTSLFA